MSLESADLNTTKDFSITMCGLAGIFAYDNPRAQEDADELLRMREQMVNRGPDGAGLWVSSDNCIGLAHRRLAIIDVSEAGAQPMVSGEGRFHIVFNGEIYNYRELRSDLQKDGAVFRSDSDTEVLLQLYAREGGAMCKKLRGMYAFAIWDSVDQSLFLARDPFGIKPLYIYDDGQVLRFASQVKALLAGGKVPADVDPHGEHSYWIWGHVAEPHTLYAKVFAFEPGTWRLMHRDGRREQHEFESVENLLAAAETPSLKGQVIADPQASLREALLDTVKHHLIADVPVGIFLSAGIDSATLVALAAEAQSTLRTITLGFEEYRGTAADETILAEKVAKQYGAQHQTVWISRSDFEDAFEQFLASMDQPTIDGLNTWLVSRAAAALGLKVALSGLGGDEFFGGYPSFQQVPRIRRLARPFAIIPGLGEMVRKVSAPLLRRVTSEKYAGLMEYGATWEGAYLLRRALRMPWECSNHVGANRYTSDDRHTKLDGAHAIVSHLESTRYMRNQLLRDADWAGMAHSLELRMPLVDVELTRHIARQRKIGTVYSKQDLAAASVPPLPRELVDRAKTGFTVPVREWLMERSQEVRGRGLRGWSRFIYTRYTENAV